MKRSQHNENQRLDVKIKNAGGGIQSGWRGRTPHYCSEKQNFLSDESEMMNEEFKKYIEMIKQADTMDDCVAVTVS